MPITVADHDLETNKLLTAVFNGVWHEVVAQDLARDRATAAKALIATTLVSAVSEGERDRARLAELAIEAVFAMPCAQCGVNVWEAA